MVFHSIKLFKCRRDIALLDLLPMLKSREFRRIWENPETGQEDVLVTSIEEVRYEEKQRYIRGLIKEDFPLVFTERNNQKKAVKSLVEIPFAFLPGSLYFLPMADRKKSDEAANVIGRELFGSELLKMTFQTGQIRTFLQRNAYTLNLCNWKELGLPGTDNVQLSGSEVRENPDYERYESMGKEKRIRITLESNGWSIGLSEDGIVTFYTDIDENRAYAFIRDKLIPILM